MSFPFRLFITSLLLAVSSVALAVDIEKLAQDDWLLVKSPNFEIVTDLNEEKARHLAEDLESYRFFSIELMKLKILPGFKPLPILAISSSSNFKKLDLPENWAGVFNLNIFGYAAIANVNNYSTSLRGQTFARQVLFHEYNHFMVRFTQNTLHYPLWYDEGMAEYWGSFKYDGEKIFIGDPHAIEGRIDDLLNMGGGILLDSEKLLNTTELPLTSNKVADKNAIGRFYAQAFFLIHYFNSAPALREDLGNYIRYLNGGYTEAQAFQKAFNMTYADLDKKAKAYLNRSLMIRVIGFQEGKVTFPKIEISVSPLDQAGFYNHISNIIPQFGVVGKDDVKKMLEKNIDLNPKDANAKAMLLTRGLADNPQKLVQEIEAENPQNPLLLNYKGNAEFANAELMRAAGIPGWEDAMKKARSFYRKAIKSDPSLAVAYAGLGNVYRFLPVSDPLQEGIIGFDTKSLYMRDQQSFSELANLYIRMDKRLEALPALRNAVSFSKEKATSPYAVILENLEMLQDTSETKGQMSADTIKYSDGNTYVGSISNGKPNGAGKMSRPNGSYYEGNFSNGLMTGQGKLVTYGGITYEGEFQNGIARGKGKLTYIGDAGFYSGEIFYALPHGLGKSKHQHTTYEGEHWFGLANGKGTLISDDEKINLAGRWIFGSFEWPEEEGTNFVGNANDNGKRDGLGICVTKEKKKIDWCTYKDGILQKDVDQSSAVVSIN